MICPICGKEVEESLYSCDICGAVLKTEPEKEGVPTTGDGMNVPPECPPDMSNFAPYGQLPEGNVPQFYGAVVGDEPFLPPVPVKKKRKKWPIVVTCCTLAFLIAVFSVFSVIFSQPMFILTMAYNKTLVQSQNLSFDITVEVEGEELEFEGELLRGETPEESLFYFAWDNYVKMEMGFYNGKLYSSFGEFDLEDSAQWSDIEDVLEEEYDVEADVEDIYMRLTADDITLEEQAAIYDEEIFPIIEDIIHVVYGEKVQFPPYLDIVNSFQLFFVDFFYTYLVLTEKDSEEGHLYAYEMNFEKAIADLHQYIKTDATLSQLADILDIVYEEWEAPFEFIEEDDEEFILVGELFVNDDGYIDTVDGKISEYEFTVRFHHINETKLDESDIKDIDVLFDISEMLEIYEGEDIPLA